MTVPEFCAVCGTSLGEYVCGKCGHDFVLDLHQRLDTLRREALASQRRAIAAGIKMQEMSLSESNKALKARLADAEQEIVRLRSIIDKMVRQA